jgi:hypothetical protein
MAFFLQPMQQSCEFEQLIEVPNGVGDQILRALNVGKPKIQTCN